MRHGETGYLFPHGDAAALAGQMALLVKDPALVDRLGRHARRFAEQLSWNTAADATEAHLQDTIRE